MKAIDDIRKHSNRLTFIFCSLCVYIVSFIYLLQKSGDIQDWKFHHLDGADIDDSSSDLNFLPVSLRTATYSIWRLKHLSE